MSEPSKPQTHPGEPAATREPYASPKLVRHGTIEDLTRGATFTSTPGDVASSAG
jgi:hypothetical protein